MPSLAGPDSHFGRGIDSGAARLPGFQHHRRWCVRAGVGAGRSDDDVSLFILYEFVVHARLAEADLGGEQVVEIAERIEEQEAAAAGTGEAEEATQPVADEGPPPELEEVIDAAAAPVQDKNTESQSPG